MASPQAWKNYQDMTNLFKKAQGRIDNLKLCAKEIMAFEERVLNNPELVEEMKNLINEDPDLKTAQGVREKCDNFRKIYEDLETTEK